jgi:ketosteroid isomerase-like protein
MRIDARTAVLTLAILSSAASAGVAAQQPAPTPAEEVEHTALRQLRAVYEKAVRDGNIDALAPYLASDFHGVMVTGRVVKSLDDLKRYWSDIRSLIGDGGTYTTTVNPELSVLLGDFALARGTTADVVVTNRRQEFRFASNWTMTLHKDNGGWKIRQVQASMDPVDNAFVREFRRRAVIFAAAVAGVVGLVVGGGATWFFARGRRAPIGKMA